MRPHPQEKLRDMGVELPAGEEGNPGFLRGAAVQCNSNCCTRGTLGPADAGWLWCCREQWKASHQSRGFGQPVPSELKQHGSVIGGILTLGWKISKNGENAGVRSTRPSKVTGDQ